MIIRAAPPAPRDTAQGNWWDSFFSEITLGLLFIFCYMFYSYLVEKIYQLYLKITQL